MQPPSLPPQFSSPFHKAGNYAIAAIIGSFFLQLLISGMRSGVPHEAGVMLGYLPALVIFSAVPAGVMALAGIRKFGFKMLLWKGIVGVTFPVVLFILSVYLTHQMRESAHAMMKEIENRRKAAEQAVPPGDLDNAGHVK